MKIDSNCRNLRSRTQTGDHQTNSQSWVMLNTKWRKFHFTSFNLSKEVILLIRGFLFYFFFKSDLWDWHDELHGPLVPSWWNHTRFLSLYFQHSSLRSVHTEPKTWSNKQRQPRLTLIQTVNVFGKRKCSVCGLLKTLIDSSFGE